MIIEERLYAMNVGDSRAVMGKFKLGNWSSIDLTTDHKPCLKSEAENIIKKGGRIEH